LADDKNPIPPDRRAPTGSPDDPVYQKTGMDSGVDVGEYMSVDTSEDGPEIIDSPDGGAFVVIGEAKESNPPDLEFYANLAETLPEDIMSKLASDLLKKIENDKESRKKRDELYEEGLRRTGLGKDAPGGAEFDGASKVVHPMMTEACIDYCARIMKEIYPVAGPVRERLIGAPTQEKADRAKRKVEHMNYQFTTQIKEARGVLEQTFTQTPLSGSEYILLYQDHRLKRPRMECMPSDKVYIPIAAADFYSANRKTWEENLTDVDFKQRVNSGMYRDLELGKSDTTPEPSKAEAANMKIEGMEDTGENIDGERTLYTSMTYVDVTEDMADELDVEEAGELYPYLITIDKTTKKVLAIYRDWEKNDEAREPIEHLFEFGFIPWRGAYSIGFAQIIGGLSAAATGALRALLDSAHANNAVTAFVLKGSGISGQSSRPQIGELIEIDAGLETDDIRKRVMPPPFNQPSPVLFQLLGLLVSAAQGVVRTTMDENATNMNSQVPVGTQLSRVEEGLVVFSHIHGRAHAAFNRLINGLHRLNRLYLPETLRVDREGKELMVRRSDYDGPIDAQPVSDPTLYSDQQRFMQITAIEQAAAMFPQLYNIREIQKRKLKLWKVPDPDALLKDEPKATEMNAIAENLAMSLGKPVVAFPEQDHLAHLKCILDFIQNPVLGANPLIAPKYLPMALQHAVEHIVFFYVKHAVDTVESAAGVKSITELMSNDTGVKAEFDKLLANASTDVMGDITQILQQYMPVLQQAQQMMQSFMPKPPMDPAEAALQAQQMETQRRSAADQAENQIEQQRVAIEQQNAQINALKVQNAEKSATITALTKLKTTQMDNATARQSIVDKAMAGQQNHMVNGEGLK